MANGVNIIDESKLLGSEEQFDEDLTKRIGKDKILSFQVQPDLKFYETHEPREIPETPDDFYHQITAGEVGRLDYLAYFYYGDPKLWWVLAQANNVKDPLFGPNAGQIIRIPSVLSLYGNGGVLVT